VINIQNIREKAKKEKYKISFTHTEKVRERKIEMREIEESISVGEKMLFLQRQGCRTKNKGGFPLG
jgi:hypothetical protein